MKHILDELIIDFLRSSKNIPSATVEFVKNIFFIISCRDQWAKTSVQHRPASACNDWRSALQVCQAWRPYITSPSRDAPPQLPFLNGPHIYVTQCGSTPRPNPPPSPASYHRHRANPAFHHSHQVQLPLYFTSTFPFFSFVYLSCCTNLQYSAGYIFIVP